MNSNKENWFQEILRLNRHERRNFKVLASVIWDLSSWLCVTILLVALVSAYFNPLWFRDEVLNYVSEVLPIRLFDLRDRLFKHQLNKARLFETIMNA